MSKSKTISLTKSHVPSDVELPQVTQNPFWHAVQFAKDVNIPKLPDEMLLNNTKIPRKDLPDAFIELFISKVKSMADEQDISDSVYNGIKKLIVREVTS